MKPSTLAFETRALAEHAGEIRKRAKQVSAIAAHLKAEGYRVLPNIEGSTK